MKGKERKMKMRKKRKQAKAEIETGTFGQRKPRWQCHLKSSNYVEIVEGVAFETPSSVSFRDMELPEYQGRSQGAEGNR